MRRSPTIGLQFAQLDLRLIGCVSLLLKLRKICLKRIFLGLRDDQFTFEAADDTGDFLLNAGEGLFEIKRWAARGAKSAHGVSALFDYLPHELHCPVERGRLP